MEQKHESKVMPYFRIKTEWVAEDERGALNKTKTEELVMAANYTDAEKTAYAIAEDQNRYAMGSVNIEIIKTKVEDIMFNEVLHQDEALLNGLVCNFFEEAAESGVGLYAVTIAVFTTDEKSGKTKTTKETIFTPATSNTDAAARVRKQLEKAALDFVVRDVKFDNAAAIYWPSATYEQKAADYDKF